MTSYKFIRTTHRIIVFFIFLFGFCGCSKIQYNGGDRSIAGATSDDSEEQKKYPWWDFWPRPSGTCNVSELKEINANMLIASPLFGDENRAPYSRETTWNDWKNLFRELKDNNIRITGYIEGQGQAIEMIGAFHQQENGSFQLDPALNGGANLVAHQWIWDTRGPTVSSDANYTSWMGLASFVNKAEWLGPYSISNRTYNISMPKYPDSRDATGYKNDDSSDPRNANLYDAAASKSINGEIMYNGGYMASLKNHSKMIPAEYIPGTDGAPADCEKNEKGKCILPTGGFYFSKDTANPFWKDTTAELINYFVEKKSDGFWMDNSSGWDFIGNNPLTTSFGDWSVAKFRDYLKENSRYVSVSDEDSFDIRHYLKMKLLEWYPGSENKFSDYNFEGWQDKRFINDPIWRAFIAFKGRTAHEYTKAAMINLKRSAENNNRDPSSLYIGGNDVPGTIFGAYEGDDVTQVNTEFAPVFVALGTVYGGNESGNSQYTSTTNKGYGIGIPPNGHTGPFYTTATSLVSSQHAIVWYYLDDLGKKYMKKPNLGQLLGFEALANNSLINVDHEFGRSPGTKESTAFVNNTIKRLTPVLGYRVRKGNVAIVYGTQTAATTLTPGGQINSTATVYSDDSISYMDHAAAFYGWGEILENLHTPYRVIPDYKLINAIENDVSVLILPHIRVIDPDTVKNVLIPFSQRGGVILVSGEKSGIIKTRKHAYARNDTALIFDMVNNGHAQFIDGNPAFDYYFGAREKDASRKDRAMKKVEAIISSLELNGKLTKEVYFNDWGGKVWVSKYENPAKTKLAYNFINTDYDSDNDQIKSTTGGIVVLGFQNGVIPQNFFAEWHDADKEELLKIDLHQVDQKHLSLTLPRFRVFGTLVLRTNPIQVFDKGVGCDNHECIWITGQGIGPRTKLTVKDSAWNPITTYETSDLLIQNNNSVQTISFNLKKENEREELFRNGLIITLENGSAYTSFEIKLSNIKLKEAGTGCDDNYCIYVVGNNLSSKTVVEVKDHNWNLIRKYSGNEINYKDSGKNDNVQTITFRLNSEEEKQELDSNGLILTVVNGNKWDSISVKK